MAPTRQVKHRQLPPILRKGAIFHSQRLPEHARRVGSAFSVAVGALLVLAGTILAVAVAAYVSITAASASPLWLPLALPAGVILGVAAWAIVGGVGYVLIQHGDESYRRTAPFRTG